MAPTDIVDICCNVKTVGWPHETNITCYMGGYKIVTPGPPVDHLWTSSMDPPTDHPRKSLYFMRDAFCQVFAHELICHWTCICCKKTPFLIHMQIHSGMNIWQSAPRMKYLRGSVGGSMGLVCWGGPPGWSTDQLGSVFCTHPLLY